MSENWVDACCRGGDGSSRVLGSIVGGHQQNVCGDVPRRLMPVGEQQQSTALPVGEYGNRPMLEIAYAWYGVEGGPRTATTLGDARRGQLHQHRSQQRRGHRHLGGAASEESIAQYIQAHFVDGANLVVPAELNPLFGDPAPGVTKALAVHVRDAQTGADIHLRFMEHVGGTWNLHTGPSRFLAPAENGSTRGGSGGMRVLYAWYGAEGGAITPTAQFDGSAVTDFVQQHFVHGDELVVPAEMNQFFGDPAPGIVKVLAVHIQNTNTGEDRHLRFTEHEGGTWNFTRGPSKHLYQAPPQQHLLPKQPAPVATTRTPTPPPLGTAASLSSSCDACASLRKRLAKEKREVADLHEELVARDVIIAELRRQLNSQC